MFGIRRGTRIPAGWAFLAAALLSLTWGSGTASGEHEYILVSSVANRLTAAPALSDTSATLRKWIPEAIERANGRTLFRVFPRDGSGRMINYVEIQTGGAPEFVRRLQEDFSDIASRWNELVREEYGVLETRPDADPRFEVRWIVETKRWRRFALFKRETEIVTVPRAIRADDLDLAVNANSLIRFLRDQDANETSIERLNKKGIRKVKIEVSRPEFWTGFLPVRIDD